MGGISNLYFIPHTNIYNSGFAYGAYDSDDLITQISYISSSKFYAIELLNEDAVYNEKKVEDLKTGLVRFEQELSFKLPQMSAAARKEWLQMMQKPNIIVFKNNDGNYHMMGKDFGCIVSGNITSGREYNSYNGINVTAVGNEKYPAYQIIGSAVTYSTTVRTSGRIYTEQSTPALD